MFGYAAFSEVPYSTLPVSGLVYAASISELASAQDAVFAASTFNANSSESVQALDSVSSAAVFFGSVSDSATGRDTAVAFVVFPASVADFATGRDTAVAFVVFPASVADFATANDQTIGSLLLSATISELVTGAETVSARANFNSSASETAQGSDQSAVVASTFSAQSSESSTASDSQTAQAVFLVNLSEAASASESTVAALVLPGSVSETAQALDSVLAAQGHASVIAETATAVELVSVVASTFSAQSSETASGSDSTSLVVVFRGAVAEQLSSSDLTSVAASIFNAVSQEQAQAQDSVDAPGSTYNPSTSETAQALDTPSAVATFLVAASETATAVDQTASIFTAVANISESATAADTTAALVAFAALTAENASASDQALVAPSTFNAIAAAAAQAFDSVNAPGSIYNAAVVNTAVALDSIIGAFLWNLIDDSQGVGWTTIATRIAFSGTWAATVVTPSAALMFNTTVDAGYLRATSTTTLPNTLPYGGYYVCSAYVNGYIYAFNFATNLYPPIRSVDGLTWELVNRPLTNHAIIAVFGNGTQLGIIQNSRAYVSTDNGATWTAGSAGFPPTGSYGEAVWDGTRYSMIIGPLRRTSTDGLTWTTNSNVGVGYDKGFIAWNGATYVTLRTSYTASFAFQSVVGISTNGVTYSTVLNTTDSSTAAVLGVANNEFFLINESGKVLKLNTATSTYTAVGQVPSTTLPRALLAVFKFGQCQGEVYVSGVRNFANDTYLTTTDFVTYTTNQLSIWTGIDDSQTPNWQNISNS